MKKSFTSKERINDIREVMWISRTNENLTHPEIGDGSVSISTKELANK